MPLPNSFSNNTNPTGGQLDANFAALGAMAVIPGTLAGTNTLVLTLAANTPSVAAYADYQVFSATAAGTNTGAATLAVGALAALGVLKDTPAGPVALAGGEITVGNLVQFTYDGALASGAGGFHIVNNQADQAQSEPSSVSSAAGVTLTAAELTGGGSGQGIILRGGSPSGGISDTTDTATALVAAMAPAVAGTTFRFRLQNSTAQTITLLAGSGVTVTGTATTAASASHDFIGRITNVGAPAVTVYG